MYILIFFNKMNWKKEQKSVYSISDNNPSTYSRVYLINLDQGLTWNPFGKSKVLPGKGGGWVWGHPNESYIIDYINSLSTIEWEDEGETLKGILVIFTSESKKSETKLVCQEISEDIKSANFILGCKIDDTLAIATDLFELDNCQIVSTPTLSDDITGHDIWDLQITPEFTFPDPAPHSIGLIIGQQGCGKSFYCKHLKKLGYIVVDEIESGKIRKGTKKSVDNFKLQIEAVKNCSIECECKGNCTNYGIIIDSTNPSVESRLPFEKISEEMEIPFVNLWLSRSGHFDNSKREKPITRIALNLYTSKLVLPDTYIRVL